MGPIVSLEMECTGFVLYFGLGLWDCSVELTEEHAEQVIRSVNLGWRAVSPGNMFLLAILMSNSMGA